MKKLIAGVFLLCLAYQMFSQILINEIRSDQNGTDNDEYFELSGTVGQSLNGYFYITIGDGTGVSGVIENVTDLSGQVIPEDGFFLCGEATMFIGTPDYLTVLNFENTDNVTHMLVTGFTGAAADDLDTNDDGILDVTPWTSAVDIVAVIMQANPPTTTEWHYAQFAEQIVGPDGSVAPAHVYRNGVGGEWIIGSFTQSSGPVETPGYRNPVHPFGNALSFDGTDDYIIIPEHPMHNITSALTLEAWIYPDSDNSGNIIAKGNNGYTFAIQGASGGSGYFGTGDYHLVYMDQSNPANSVFSTATYSLNVWSHVAITVSDIGTDLEIYFYVNGIQDGPYIMNSNILNGTTDQQLYVSLRYYSTSGYFDGNIDEIRVWHTIRTAEEIQNNLKSVLVGDEVGLSLYYPLDWGIADSDNAGRTIATDYVTNCLADGSLTNFALSGTESNIVFTGYVGPAITTTQEASSITDNGVHIDFDLISTGISDVTEIGIEISTIPCFMGIISTAYPIPGPYGVATYNMDISGLTELTQYYARPYAINGFNKNYGDVVIFSTLASPPEIVQSPESVTLCEGTNHIFQSYGTSSETIFYQWQYSDNDIDYTDVPESGVFSATSVANLMISDVSGLDGKYFRCAYSNTGGTAYTNSALLNVDLVPDVSEAGFSFSVCGYSSDLDANTPVVGTGTWSVLDGDGIFTDENSPATGVDGMIPGDNTFVWTIENGVCPASSSTVTITSWEYATPAVTCDDIESCFTVVNITADEPLVGHGEWVASEGVNFDSESNYITNVYFPGPGLYYFTWTVTNGPCSSFDYLDVLVLEEIEIVSQPEQNTVVNETETIVLTAVIAGDIISFEWYKDDSPLTDGGNISGSATSELTITGAGIEDSGTYTLHITGDCNNLVTNNSVVSVLTNIISEKTVSAELFPNPNNGIFTIQYSAIGTREYKIYNVAGEVVYSESACSDTQKFDLSFLCSGLYFVEISTNSEQLRLPVVIK